MRIDKATRLLAMAASQAESIAALAAELHISERQLQHYILGNEPVPEGLFLEVVDILLERMP